MKSLILIESPFQLLGAIEAKKSFKIENATLIIKYTNNNNNNTQIDNLLNLYNFNSIIRLPKVKKGIISDFVLITYILKWKLSRKKFKYIFIGDQMNLIMRCFSLNLDSDETYFLDDGAQTIYIQDKIRSEVKNIYEEPSKLFRTKLRLAMMYFLNLKHKYTYIPNVFTCFNIESFKNQKIIHHSFDSIKKNEISKNKQNESIVYFIGGCLSESEIFSEDIEIYIFSKIVSYYKEQKLTLNYCCHRKDSLKKIDRIKKIDPSIKIHYSKSPIELEFILNDTQIFHIASFFSTALYTTTLIHKPITSLMFKIPTELINPFHVEGVESVEKNFTKSEIIKLVTNYIN
jgi:hypothetical protein